MAVAAGPPARIVHRIPGRLRLKFDRTTTTPERLGDLCQAVLGVRGVQSSEPNPLTVSLVVYYDEAALDGRRLATAVGGIADPAPGRARLTDADDDVPSWISRQIDVRIRLLDRRLRHLTGGRFDLRTLLPVGFAAMALREMVVSHGMLPPIPWYVLLWYAIDSYLRLHATPTGRATSSLMEAMAQAVPVGE